MTHYSVTDGASACILCSPDGDLQATIVHTGDRIAIPPKQVFWLCNMIEGGEKHGSYVSLLACSLWAKLVIMSTPLLSAIWRSMVEWSWHRSFSARFQMLHTRNCSQSSKDHPSSSSTLSMQIPSWSLWQDEEAIHPPQQSLPNSQPWVL